MKQVIVVGGGVVGCTTAMQLALRGYRVSVVERNTIAAQTSGESSWAGAGIVFPLLPWFYQDAVNQLALAGAKLYPTLAVQLKMDTGIDPECIQSGMLIKPPYAQEAALTWCQRLGVPYNFVGEDLLLPEVFQIRNPSLLQALKAWLIKHDVNLIEQTQLTPIDEKACTQQLTNWATTDGRHLEADIYVVTSGAWSFELLKQTALTLNIKPMRGQILLYKTPTKTIPHIIYQDGFYLVPRCDDVLLAGSTLEDVGFDAGVTEAAKQAIQQQAEAILPQLKQAEILKHWSGLRPGTPDNIPTIARHPSIQNVYLNTGHFRYGITMAPESARIICDLIAS